MVKCISFITILLTTSVLLAACIDGSKTSNAVARENKIVQPTDLPMENIKPPIRNILTPTKIVDSIKDKINEMTLDEKIGQMIISGVNGYAIDDNTKKMIQNDHVGGFIIFGQNVEDAKQLLKLINSLKTTNSINKIPLFLSIDQEGGRVSRMPAEFKGLPTSKAIGRVNNSDFSYRIGGIISEELNLFGFNMDFAPVLDINSNPNNHVIGDRSFGTNPDIVAKLAIQTIKGIHSGNVISVVKHFPGHGDTSLDSHERLPSVNSDMKRLESFELIPFVQAINNKADMVMVAHILLPKIDPKYPASMSEIIITDILRKDLNFDGVVITDDITMGAITNNYNIRDAAIKSVNAGIDIILVCHGYDNERAVIDALMQAVQRGQITEDRVNQSVYRILKLKQKYNINSNTIKSVDVNEINSKIKNILNTYMK